MVHGPSGAGKTFVVIDLCCRVAGGYDRWMGENVKKWRGCLSGWRGPPRTQAADSRMETAQQCRIVKYVDRQERGRH